MKSQRLLAMQRVLGVTILGTLVLFMVACGGSGNSISGPGLGDPSNNSMLHGQYAFSFSGQSRSSGAVISGVGTFTADGNGNITGTQDANIGNGSRTFNFNGKYTVGTDLRGTAILTGLQVCPNWQFTMLNSSHALLTCFDTGNTASGAIDVQDPTAFSLAKLTGKYVFSLSGAGVNSGVSAIAGDWSMDGQGALTGEVDVNDTLALAIDRPLTGTYTVNSNSRGTMALSTPYGTQNFVFYVVSATDLKLLESDALTSTTPFVSGEALAQASSPFNLNTANSGFAFTLGGADSGLLALGIGGVFSSNGTGTLSSVIDFNDAGLTNLSFPSTGSYSISSTGRASLTLNTGSFGITLAAYPAANGTWQLIELDGNGTTTGAAKLQLGAFSTGSVTGSYALNWTGTLDPVPSFSSSPSEEDIIGQVTADGAGNLGGTLDVNSIANILQGLSVSGSTYTMTGNGRGTATINTQAAGFNMQVYQVDANNLLFLDTDPQRVLVGVMQK